ncbi:MAG TPA: hypothetical protein VGK73_06140 [Polyangiaceae bacterium]
MKGRSAVYVPAAKHRNSYCFHRSGRQICGFCLERDDPPCSDPNWQAPCFSGAPEAYCSDLDANYRLGCTTSGTTQSGIFTFVACTCDPDAEAR